MSHTNKSVTTRDDGTTSSDKSKSSKSNKSESGKSNDISLLSGRLILDGKRYVLRQVSCSDMMDDGWRPTKYITDDGLRRVDDVKTILRIEPGDRRYVTMEKPGHGEQVHVFLTNDTNVPLRYERCIVTGIVFNAVAPVEDHVESLAIIGHATAGMSPSEIESLYGRPERDYKSSVGDIRYESMTYRELHNDDAGMRHAQLQFVFHDGMLDGIEYLCFAHSASEM